MHKRYQPIGLSEIPRDLDFEGYCWFSNRQTPELLRQGKIDPAWFTDLPFVVEANFYAPSECLSIQVRNIDGAYQVARIDLRDLDTDHFLRRRYIGHRLEDLDIHVVEAWIPVADDFTEGMETLVPAWTAFAGFIDKNH